MRKRRVGVLMGGLSSERSASLKSGQAVAAALGERGHEAVPIFVDRDVDLALRQAQIDVAFVALHGRYGEDGCLQGLLETLGIPYTGSDVLASALAMHKVKAKELFRLHNLPTPPYYVLPRAYEQDVCGCHGDFGFPVVVKPVREGSSVGVAIARTPDDLARACERAFCFDDDLLVERYVAGREVSVAVLEDRPLGAIEIVPKGDFFDCAAKYARAGSQYFIPPRLGPERYRGVLAQALGAHRALGCGGVSQVDLIVSDVGNEFVLEVNTSPGMAPGNLLPKIAHAAGVPFADLAEAILGGARLHSMERGQRDRRVARRRFVGEERRQAPAAEPH